MQLDGRHLIGPVECGILSIPVRVEAGWHELQIDAEPRAPHLSSAVIYRPASEHAARLGLRRALPPRRPRDLELADAASGLQGRSGAEDVPPHGPGLRTDAPARRAPAPPRRTRCTRRSCCSRASTRSRSPSAARSTATSSAASSSSSPRRGRSSSSRTSAGRSSSPRATRCTRTAGRRATTRWPRPKRRKGGSARFRVASSSLGGSTPDDGKRRGHVLTDVAWLEGPEGAQGQLPQHWADSPEPPPPAWFCFTAAPGARSITLPIVGEVQAWVDGDGGSDRRRRAVVAGRRTGRAARAGARRAPGRGVLHRASDPHARARPAAARRVLAQARARRLLRRDPPAHDGRGRREIRTPCSISASCAAAPRCS